MRTRTSLHWLLIIVILIIDLCNFNQAAATTIYSTVAGGNWNVISTWEGGQFPGSSDDVVIRTGATVNTILGSYTSCNNLTVQTGGTLIYNGSGTITLTLNGSLINNGAIRNGSGNLILSISQNANYHGSEWSNFRIIFTGTANHAIAFGTGKIFTGSNFVVEGSPRNVYGNSSLTFSNTTIDFNGSTLVLADDCKLSLSGQSLNDIILSGVNNKIEMTGDAIFANSSLNGTTIFGKIRVSGGSNIFTETITITPGAIIENYGSSHSLYINGSIVNNGTVTNTSNNLSVYISGDLTQNGIWNAYETFLNGTSDQHITFGNGAVFQGNYFKNNNATTKTIHAMSDLTFYGTHIDFANGSPGSVRGDLVLPDGKCLKVSGNGSAKVLNRMNLASTGTEARLWMLSGAYLTGFSNSCPVLTLLGQIQVGNSEIYLNNHVSIADTLMNYGSSHAVYVNGTLHNPGYIMNGSNNLEIQITGNIIHHGMEWSNHKVLLNGTSLQNVDFAPSSAFTGSYFETNGAHPLNITSDLTFQTTKLALFFSPVTVSNGKTLSISGSGAYLINCTMNGDFSLELTGGAYIQGITFNGDISLHGNTQIYQTNVYCNSEVVNTGTLQNQNTTAHTLYLNDHFFNGGTVENGAGMGNFTLELKGNIINDGTWSNYENKVNGTSDQHIRLNQDKPINAKFILYSNIGGSNWQWYKNGQIIQGATSPNLTLNQVTIAEYGLYYCNSSGGQSRIFTINKYMTVDFTGNPLTGCQPMTVNFTDNTVSPYPVQSRYWEFGDGGNSGSQDPSHQYNDHDAYDVSLTVSDGYVSRKKAKTGYVTVNMSPAPDFSFTNVCLGNAMNFDDQTTDILLDETFETQYASQVINFSSQYSPGNWSAQQALGAPDVYPNHVDDTHAWASSTANGQREFLELRFPAAKQTSKIIIYETLYPGTVDTVYVKNPATNLWVMVWSGTASPQPLVARGFEVTFPLTAFPVTDIRIAFNSPVVPYWNEIDAVAMISTFTSGISSQTTYLWNVGENGITFNTKGDISYTYQNPGDHDVTLTVTNNGICSGYITKTVTVFTQSIGGSVTGGSDIHWGQSTGTLTLAGHTGSVIKWQKRLNSSEWQDVSNTQTTYSEIPVSMGNWDYRALVQNSSCDPAFSGFTSVTVLKPLAVTWNGTVSSAWNTENNWTPAYVPDADIDVIIPDINLNNPVVTGNRECNNVTVHSSGLLTISPGAVLTVNGDFLVEGN